MDFAFTEEQTLLKNSVDRFVSDRYDFDTRQSIVKSDEGWRRDYWQQFAELGLLAAPFPEELGGFGGSAVEAMLVMESFGRALVVEPYLPTVVLGGGALRHGGSTAQQQEHMEPLITGERLFALAYAEPQSRFDLFDVVTQAKKQGGDYVLSGRKSVVVGAPWADWLIVSARTSGGQRDEGGVTLFLVEKSSPGITTRDYQTVDGSMASEVQFDSVKVPAGNVLGTADNGLALLDQVVDDGIAALCAEAMGAMKVINDITIDYAKNRKQFGTPIGKFQVLQHRMVDMYMHYEKSVSITYMATLKLGFPAAQRMQAVSAAKTYVGKAGRFIGQSAVQIHGGMGVTDELNVGHYFKRLTMIDTMFGNVDHHLRRYMALSQAA